MRKYSIQDIDKMDGHEFEYFCAELLEKNGYYNVEVTPGSGDQGIDVIAYKDEIKFGIQCKCYSSDIGNKAVQETFSGKEFYKCHIGIVLSNRFFTRSAIELARGNRILLWDREYLISLLKNTDLFYEGDVEEEDSSIVGTDETRSIETVSDDNLNEEERTDEIQLEKAGVKPDGEVIAGGTESEGSENTELIYEDNNENGASCIINTEEALSTGLVTSGDLNEDERTDETEFIETGVDIDSNANAKANDAEYEKRFDVFLRVDNKQVIKNTERRISTARKISIYTGLSFAEAQAKLYSSPAALMTGVSQEDAEKIVNRLKLLGCTVYLEENKESNQEEHPSAFSNIKDTFSAVFYIILGILPPIMTKVCWDWEHSMGNGFGICTAICVILTFLITIPMAILLIYALSHNQQ